VVVQGALFVGLVDAARNGTLHTATLQAGDMFVFPKGMVHFQSNNGTDVARAFSAFGSASPGTISLPTELFETGIDDPVLEKSFHTDQATVDALKHDLQQTPAPAPPQDSAAVALVGARLAAVMLCVVGTAFSLVL
jgi:oxalate decarboxylase/phosphoglucose isomerase-like protein (cupin superfamily)